MRKIISILLALILCLLSACDNSHSDDKTTKNPDKPSDSVATEPTLQTEPYQDVMDQLIGTWEQNIWNNKCIYCFLDYEHFISIYVAPRTHNYNLTIYEGTYELIDEKTISITETFEGENDTETYAIFISDDELIFESVSSSDFMEFKRTPKNEGTNIAVGNWEVFGIDEEAVYYSFNSRMTDISNMVLYNDGTYIFQSNEYTRHGSYTVVHDGTSLCLDEEYYCHIEFPCPSVMLITYPSWSIPLVYTLD